MRIIDWNHLIDTLLCIDVCSVATVGFIEYSVIPSEKAPNASRFFMGLHQQQWEGVHTVLSALLLGLVVLHVWFNQSREIVPTKSYFADRWRKTLLILTGVWLCILFLAWLTLKL
jgi:hypothetical protein